MPNKTWNMNTDLLPGTTNSFNLGNLTKKWVVNGYALGDACAKGVTDNTASVPISSTDTNLVTGRTVYYAIQDAQVKLITNSQIDALFNF